MTLTLRLAFGRLVGSIMSVFYWLSNPIWLGGTLAATSMAVRVADIAERSRSPPTARCARST